MEIQFNKFGKSFGTRRLGQEVRKSIISELRTDNFVIFNFEGVEVVSNCFADECLAKLLDEFDFGFIKKNTTFKNTNDFVRRVISNAIKHRIEKMQLVEA